LDEELGAGWSADFHPDDLPSRRVIFARACERCEGFRVEYRLRRHDGNYRWMLDCGTPRRASDGSFLGYHGSCVDITSLIWARSVMRRSERLFIESPGMFAEIDPGEQAERRVTEEGRSSMSQRFLEGLELERVRLARDLREDIGQRLALLMVELDELRRRPFDSPDERGPFVDTLKERTSDLAAAVCALSQRLHSSKLLLGVMPALRGYCTELSVYKDVEIRFTHHDVPRCVSTAISRCLFRVLQESLDNALRHSSVRRFDVKLCGTADSIRLSISDAGSGFDLNAALREQGLGLTRMTEHVRLVAGDLRITTKSGRGTTILASVPLNR
jgi:signal transduction histidine kinase